MKVCTIEGCDKPVSARGWCGMHYMRWRTHGDPTYTKRPGYGSGRLTSGRHGYVRVWAPGHPLADSIGYAYEHRKMAYDAGLLTDLSMQVHHINGDRADNRLDNFEVMSNSDHHRLHVQEYVTNQYGTWPTKYNQSAKS